MYIVLGKNKEERVKYAQWIFRDNYHIKSIQEVFKNRNSWVEVNFDCEFSRDAVIERIKKKEGE